MMNSLYPDTFSDCVLVNVVMCPNGYQAHIEQTIKAEAHPHLVKKNHYGKANTPCQAIKKVMDMVEQFKKEIAA